MKNYLLKIKMYDLFLSLPEKILFNLKAKKEYYFFYEREAEGDNIYSWFSNPEVNFLWIPIIFSSSPLKLPLNVLLDYNYINFN